MNKKKQLDKFMNMIKNKTFSEPDFRRLIKHSFEAAEVIDFLPYLNSTHSNYIRLAVFELMSSSGHDPIHLFETYFSEETNNTVPGKIMGYASKTENENLVLAVYSKYPTLSNMALMTLKRMKKFDAIAPFMFSDDVALANLASEILKKED